MNMQDNWCAVTALSQADQEARLVRTMLLEGITSWPLTNSQCVQALLVAQRAAKEAEHDPDAQGLLILMLHAALPPSQDRDAKLLQAFRRLQLCQPDSPQHIEAGARHCWISLCNQALL